jgi:hypothetical protein
MFNLTSCLRQKVDVKAWSLRALVVRRRALAASPSPGEVSSSCLSSAVPVLHSRSSPLKKSCCASGEESVCACHFQALQLAVVRVVVAPVRVQYVVLGHRYEYSTSYALEQLVHSVSTFLISFIASGISMRGCSLFLQYVSLKATNNTTHFAHRLGILSVVLGTGLRSCQMVGLYQQLKTPRASLSLNVPRRNPSVELVISVI